MTAELRLTPQQHEPVRVNWPQAGWWRILDLLEGQAGQLDLWANSNLPIESTVEDAIWVVSEVIRCNPCLMSIAYLEGSKLVQRCEAQSPIVIADPLVPQDYEGLARLVSSPDRGKPVTAAVFVDERNRARRVTLRVSHLATDAYGIRLIRECMKAKVAVCRHRDGPTSIDPESLGPRDVMGIEESRDGRVRTERALVFAEQQLRQGPSSMHGSDRLLPAPRGGRYWEGELVSRRLFLALRKLTAEGVSVTGALLGAVAAVTAARIGTSSATLTCWVGNRIEKWARAYSGLLSQEAAVCVPIAGLTMGEILREATKRSLTAQRFGHHDYWRMQGLREQIGRERGVTIDSTGDDVVVNVARMDGLFSLTPDPAAPENEGDATSFAWKKAWSADCMYLVVELWFRDSTAAMAVKVDAMRIGLDEVEQMLRDVEQSLWVSAASPTH